MEAEVEAEAEERCCASTAEVEAMEERRFGQLGLACANCAWCFFISWPHLVRGGGAPRRGWRGVGGPGWVPRSLWRRR